MKRTLSYTITNKNKADTIGAFLRDAGYSRRILIELKQNPEQISRTNPFLQIFFRSIFRLI